MPASKKKSVKRKTSTKKSSKKKTKRKSTKKSPVKKKSVRRSSRVSITKSRVKEIDFKVERMERLNKVLVENFVSLQKVMTNFAGKFESLSEQIAKLLQLFEISAKSFVEKQKKGEGDIQKDAEFLNKLNTLMNQNKTIAKGLTLLGDEVKDKVYGGMPRGHRPMKGNVDEAPKPLSPNSGLDKGRSEVNKSVPKEFRESRRF